MLAPRNGRPAKVIEVLLEDTTDRLDLSSLKRPHPGMSISLACPSRSPGALWDPQCRCIDTPMVLHVDRHYPSRQYGVMLYPDRHRPRRDRCPDHQRGRPPQLPPHVHPESRDCRYRRRRRRRRRSRR